MGVGALTDPAQVAERIFGHAADASIVTLQNELEALSHSIRKQARKRDAAAG